MARVQPNRFGRFDQGPTQRQREIARDRIIGVLNRHNGILQVDTYKNAPGILLQQRCIWRPQDLGKDLNARVNTVKLVLEELRLQGIVYYDLDSGLLGLKELRKKRDHRQRYPHRRQAA